MYVATHNTGDIIAALVVMGYKGHSVVYMMVFMCTSDKTTLMLLGFPWK